MGDKLEREEGEMSEEDESMSVDEELLSSPTQEGPAVTDDCAIFYRLDEQGLIVEKLENPDSVKLEDRARRFGANHGGVNVISQKQIEELYKDIGIDETNKRHIQFDTIHMKGVDGLTTSDIFSYLKDYKPVSVQRISTSSCNVLCKDHISAALAILVNSREIIDEDTKAVAKRYPPYQWREGLAHPFCDLILMRFATHSDTLDTAHRDRETTYAREDETLDSSGKNPWGDLCRSWGVYDHQEMYGPKLPPKSYIKTEAGIIRKHRARNSEEAVFVPRILSTHLAKRLGKRQYEVEISSDKSNSDDEWKKKSKVPRMRMRADDEEKKIKSMHPVVVSQCDDDDSYKPLSIQIDNTNDEKSTFNSGKSILSDTFSSRLKSRPGNSKVDIQSRLGERVTASSEDESSNDSSSYLQLNIMSKIQKAPQRHEKKKLASVWTRLDKSGSQTDLRQMLKKPKSVTQSDQSDLRGKLKEKRRSPLRIEIDNEYYESD